MGPIRDGSEGKFDQLDTRAAQSLSREANPIGDAAKQQKDVQHVAAIESLKADVKAGAAEGRSMMDNMFIQLGAQTPESQEKILAMLQEGMPTAEQAGKYLVGRNYPINEEITDPSQITAAWTSLSKKFKEIGAS